MSTSACARACVCAGGGDVMFKLSPSPGHGSSLPNQILAVLANLMFRELNLKIAQVGVIIQQKCRLVFPWPIPETSNSDRCVGWSPIN